jgi:hypothetical protein
MKRKPPIQGVKAMKPRCEQCNQPTVRVCPRCGRWICRVCAEVHWNSDDVWTRKRCLRSNRKAASHYQEARRESSIPNAFTKRASERPNSEQANDTQDNYGAALRQCGGCGGNSCRPPDADGYVSRTERGFVVLVWENRGFYRHRSTRGALYLL